MRRLVWLLGLACGSACGGCGSSDPPAVDNPQKKACISGELAPCACPGGATGEKTCLTSGDGFGSCECSPRGRQNPTVRHAAGGDAPRAGGGEGRAGEAGRGGASGASGGDGSRTSEIEGAAPAAGSGGTPGTTSATGDLPPDLLPVPEDEASYLFDDGELRTYDIVIAANDLATIDSKPSDERWVPASLEFEGMSYGPFMIRYKGSSGTFKAPCTTGGPADPKQGKCSMKLGFDEIDPELRFFGLKKLNFHAVNQDPSLMRDRLSYSLFRDHRVAASRAVHARVLVNGRLEGLFVAVEQVDGRFTRARFGEGGEGNLYKEAWVTADTGQNYLDALETNTDEMPDVSRMLAFQDAVRTSAEEVLRFVDKEYMLRYFAVDRVIMNDDGVLHFYCDPNSPEYLGTSHNFYWYAASTGDRHWLIPWDLDLTFDATPWVRITPHWMAEAPCTCVKNTMYDAQTPPSCDPLVKHVIAWREDYEKEVDSFIAGAFSQSNVDAKLNAWITLIRPAVTEAAGVNFSPTETEWNDAVVSLRSTIIAARQNRGYAY